MLAFGVILVAADIDITVVLFVFLVNAIIISGK